MLSDAVINETEAKIKRARIDNQDYLRSQRTVWSLDPLLVFLIVLTVTFLALTIYSIIQENLVLLDIKETRFFALKIFDTTSASSLFVTLLGALLVRHQFVLGFRPRIGYKSIRTVKQNTLNSNESWETWQVKIRNVGLGPAIINHSGFALEASSIKRNSSPISLKDVIKELAKMNLIHGTDYWLENVTAGFTLPPNDDCIVFEIKTEHIPKIKHLDMILYFQGFLGDKYYRKAFLIPSEWNKKTTQ